MAGRPTKYCSQVIEQLLTGIEQGLTIDLSCRMAGISDDTFSNWRKRYADFAVQIDAANARGALANLQFINDSDDWRAKAWILERRHGYRVEEKLTVAGDADAPLILRTHRRDRE